MTNDELAAYRADRAERAEAHAERLASALQSIARNGCCDGCQEAALVARQALSDYNQRTET